MNRKEEKARCQRVVQSLSRCELESGHEGVCPYSPESDVAISRFADENRRLSAELDDVQEKLHSATGFVKGFVEFMDATDNGRRVADGSTIADHAREVFDELQGDGIE